ncbi:MAG TPA: GspE/PulE family protein [Candidatus Limnocylindrales bacterium]|jgi:type IV pilus assembly protein PilB|nr:GspE/PulE family protein [Candidatus Limnocylindrales bacterium]
MVEVTHSGDTLAADAGVTPPAPPRLGDLLLRAGLISADQLEAALAAQNIRRKRLGEVLREDGVVDEVGIATVLSVQLDAPLVDLRERPSDEAALRTLAELDARRLLVVPLAVRDESLVIATEDPGNRALIEEVTGLVGRPVQPLLALRSDIEQAIRGRYRITGDLAVQVTAFASSRPNAPAGAVAPAPELEHLREAPVVQIVNLLVGQALRDRASDLHIEPQGNALRIRTRVDGLLRDVASLPADLAPGLVSRIKILADLNIVEKQRAQDGQITMEIEGRSVDIRVATMRTIWGEKVVMRLLDRDRSVLRLGDLGFPVSTLPAYERLLRSRYGMVIVAGPTGSGKTTTLYASINEIDRDALNVTTIEDPVEYTFERVNQTQVNAQAGVTFASGLRAILRQDPDVILVGEMRDRDTAEIAVQASMTGHLVLSSMHATDAVSALFRLLEMGIEPFLVSASVTGIAAQRLMRRTCPHCRIEIEPTTEEATLYASAGLEAPARAYLGRGCTYCGGTGYLDRIGVYELLLVTPAVRRLIAQQAHYDEVRSQALADGMVPLRIDALRKAATGVTTVSEAVRAVSG